MKIVHLAFEENLVFSYKDKIVTVTVFKTEDEGNLKLGITAPKQLAVNREEIYLLKKQQQEKIHDEAANAEFPKQPIF